jgi:pimeloyl-ACP methyl ester carboxylesterase
LGSAVAHAFIRIKPECVDKLVLDGFGLYTPRHTRTVKYFFKLPYFLLVAYYRRVLRRLIQDGGDSETHFYNIYLQEILASKRNKNSFIGQFKLLVDIFDHPEKYRLFQTVEKPGKIQLILAKDDRGFTAEERQALIDSYPGARVHTFQAGGHLAAFNHRAEFDRVLDEFLDS